MEKYSNWRDAGTGIQPFLPPAPIKVDLRFGALVLALIQSYILGPFLALVRSLLLLPVALLALLLIGLKQLLVVKFFQRAFHTTIVGPLVRLILLLLGFHFIHHEIVSLKKGRRDANTTASGKRTAPVTSPQAGDLLVTNHASYIDIFYLYAHYDPVFVQMDATVTDPRRFRRISVGQALQTCGECPMGFARGQKQGTKEDEGTLQTLPMLTRNARAHREGPVVVFLEGTTSNGRALLKPLEVFRNQEDVDPESRLFPLLFKYNVNYPSPVFPTGNQYLHALRTCSKFDNVLQVKELSQGEVPSLSELHLPSANAKTYRPQEDADFNGQLAQILANMGRLRTTKQGIMEKKTFLEFYHRQK